MVKAGASAEMGKKDECCRCRLRSWYEQARQLMFNRKIFLSGWSVNILDVTRLLHAMPAHVLV
jgi:hypothetical protein